MAYTYPASAVLGASKTGLTIGYRLVNLDGTQNAAFTTTNVAETSVPGNYTVTGGVSLSDGFIGRIEWGTSGTKYAEEWLGPNGYEYSDAKTSAVKSKTDALPSDPADASDISTAFGTVNTTLGTIASYIDTEVAAIKAKTDNIPASPAAVGSAMTLTSGERDSIAAAYLDLSNGVETGLTPRQAMRLFAAALAGKLSGSGTTTITIQNAVADNKTRITATCVAAGSSAGDRTAIVYDLT